MDLSSEFDGKPDIQESREDVDSILEESKSTKHIQTDENSTKSKLNNTEQENDIMKLFENELKDYSQVLKFIEKLQMLIERQRKILCKYHERFKQINKQVNHIAIQTDVEELIQNGMPTDDKGVLDIDSFKKDIVQAAHSAVQKTGFVYEPVSGLYYDYNTGYYYNSELGLYYDGNTSSYYYYNEQTKQFQFHSQVQLQPKKPSGPEKIARANETINKYIKDQVHSNVPDNATSRSYPNNPESSSQTKSYSSTHHSTNTKKSLLKPALTSSLIDNKPSAVIDCDMLSDVSSNSDLPETDKPESDDFSISSEEKEEGELSEEEPRDVEMKHVTQDDTQTQRFQTPMEYYSSEEYKQYYEKVCSTAVVQIANTPIAYDPNSEAAKNVNPALRTEEYEIAHAWPPCLRIIVKETTLKNLQVGTLFMVTYLGGSVGREGDHAVLIPDINISKHHAKIDFTGNEDEKDDPTKGYVITDLGSRNGTYIDNERLSAALQESEPRLLKHGMQLKIGCTTLLVHIHNGRDTCNECEPGLIMTANEQTPTQIDLSETTKEKRQAEMKRLRKKFGLDKTVPAVDTKTTKVKKGGRTYEDRAEIRRKTVGSHVEGEKTHVATVNDQISNENKGFKMLSKMGWKSGQTLGKDEMNSSALVEPIIAQQYAKNAGLGSSMSAPISSSGSVESSLGPKEEKKINVWKKTQARYNELGDGPPPPLG